MTLETLKKRVKVGQSSIFEIEKMYGRYFVLSESLKIPRQMFFGCELSPVPSSNFDVYGDMRKGNKSLLVEKLAVYTTEFLVAVDLELVDGNEALYHTKWPKNVTLKAFADNFIGPFSKVCDTYYI